MKKIDTHHHLVEEKGYLDNLLREMDKYEIEKLALIGLGTLFKGMFVKGEHDGSSADDDAVERAVHQHSDRFLGLGYIRLGKDSPDKVDHLRERGFAGLKFIIPTKRYCEEEFFPVYEKAQKFNLPCLFHTGIINFPEPYPEERVSSFYMDIIHLEAIAQVFPKLKIIAAHLGVQNFLTGLTLIRLFPNIYADLSGTTPGWRANISYDDWKKYLWFPHASKKILFGTDVHWDEIGPTIDIYNSICEAANWDEEQKKQLYFENAKSLFFS